MSEEMLEAVLSQTNRTNFPKEKFITMSTPVKKSNWLYKTYCEDNDQKTFRREFLGEWVAQCSVRDNKGKHCPDKPDHYFEYNGKEVGLCERCFEAYNNGAFDRPKRNCGERLYIA